MSRPLANSARPYDAVVLLKDGNDLRFSAHHGPIGINLEKWPISRNWTAGRAFLDRRPVHIPDMLSDEGAEFPDSRELSRHTGTAGVRSILAVPLLRENESIGTILLRRTEVQPFSDKQIALLQTFADQAVIAIGNVHLFDEVQARTRDLSESLQQQTASAEVLKVISRSPDKLKPVLDVIVETSRELCNAFTAVIFLLRDGKFRDVADSNDGNPCTSRRSAPIQSRRIKKDQSWPAPRAKRRTVHIPNSAQDPRSRTLRGPLDSSGPGSLLSVPLILDASRHRRESLSQSQFDRAVHRIGRSKLLQTFADQAVIAFRNVGLFDEVQAADPRVVAVARRLAHRAGPSGADRETGVPRPAHGGHRARDQEPAQFRQQFRGAFGGTDRRTQRRCSNPPRSRRRPGKKSTN